MHKNISTITIIPVSDQEIQEKVESLIDFNNSLKGEDYDSTIPTLQKELDIAKVQLWISRNFKDAGNNEIRRMVAKMPKEEKGLLYGLTWMVRESVTDLNLAQTAKN